jgi:hypothetical protein
MNSQNPPADIDLAGSPSKASRSKTKKLPPRESNLLRSSPQKNALSRLSTIGESILFYNSETTSEENLGEQGCIPVTFSSPSPPLSTYATALNLANDFGLRPALKSTKSSLSTRSRSTSPVKTMHDLAIAEPPIRFFKAGREGVVPPEEVSQLYKKLLEVCEGFQLLPGSFKVITSFTILLDNTNRHR